MRNTEKYKKPTGAHPCLQTDGGRCRRRFFASTHHRLHSHRNPPPPCPCPTHHCKNQTVKNLRIVAQWWTLSGGHLLRLSFGVFRPSEVSSSPSSFSSYTYSPSSSSVAGIFAAPFHTDNGLLLMVTPFQVGLVDNLVFSISVLVNLL